MVPVTPSDPYSVPDGFRLSLEEHPSDADLNTIVSNLIRFNDLHSAPEKWRRVAVLLRDSEGAMHGGLLGWTHWNWLFVSHLWLADAQRGQGRGRELLLLAEREALARGCRHAWVDTFSFQARDFYEKLGYQVFGTLADYPPGHTRFFLRKLELQPSGPG